MMAGLSQSNEDYLEAILVVGLEQGIVRIKDLAQHMGVKAPSVVTAVKRLTEEGLVRHESYGHVELTAQGFELAQDIHNRHKLIFRFLHSFLGIDEETAKSDACEIEHGVSSQTMDRIVSFLEFMETCPADQEPRWLLAFRHFVATGDLPESCRYLAEHGALPSEAGEPDAAVAEERQPQEESTTLAELTVGQEAEVIRVGGGASLKRRLLAMGIVPGAKVSVRHSVSTNDSMDIVARGYHLSLQKTEADHISVKGAKDPTATN
jgi:DtxR family Mn-dependent transcriptional regulator